MRIKVTRTEELLALGVFGRGSRLQERVEMLLRCGREFSPRVSKVRFAVSAVALLGLVIGGALTPRWIALAQEKPSFEVASVKPTGPERRGLHQLNCAGGTGWAVMDEPLLYLIQWAYDLPPGTHQVSGGPNWLDSPETGFDVQSKTARRVSPDECRLMGQSLLADRFKLAVHWETKELPVFVLSVGSKGSKLHEAGEDPKVLSSVTLNGAKIQVGDGYRSTASGRGMSMSELARFLMTLPVVGRPVIDKTGLAAFYGFSLDFAWEPGDDNRPDIFTAVQEQLGLKLEASKGPVEVLVIDSVEKPDPN
jgi:uncharacterized protein (TIGR03435 family)